MITEVKVFVKFQTSNFSMLVGMPWLWSCWLDRPCTTWEFQAKIWGIWWIQLEFLILDPFSLYHFFEPDWYLKNKNPHFWPFPKGPKCIIKICTIFYTVSLSLILHLFTSGTVEKSIECSLVRPWVLVHSPFLVSHEIWRAPFSLFSNYSTITFL